MVISTVKFSSVFSDFLNFLGFLTCAVTETLAIVFLFCSLTLFLSMKRIHAHDWRTPKILKNYKSENTVLPQITPSRGKSLFTLWWKPFYSHFCTCENTQIWKCNSFFIDINIYTICTTSSAAFSLNTTSHILLGQCGRLQHIVKRLYSIHRGWRHRDFFKQIPFNLLTSFHYFIKCCDEHPWTHTLVHLSC